MLTISLLRHAKSSRDDPSLEDRERPLAKRGTRDARRIGAWMEQNGLRPELVLCSEALRTRATLMLLMAEMNEFLPEVVYDPALYMADEAELFERLRGVDQRFGHMMMIGHNPGLHALAVGLVGSGPRKRLDALAERLPTAGLVVVEFDLKNWSSLKRGTGCLRQFKVPRSLG
jgi:phosphohistidine phosphatase